MTITHAIFTGIVQGISEFLPISSSGHLVLLGNNTLAFDTTLHLGTALAIVLYFFTDLKNIVVSMFKDLPQIVSLKFKGISPDSSLGLRIFIGCIPAGLLGFFLEDVFENVFRDAIYVALFLFLGSLVMLGAERYLKRKNTADKDISVVSIKDSLIIGFFQALALFPGFSRSGSTISGGIYLGMSRETSARFSFLLSVPIIIAAGVFSLVKSIDILADTSPYLFIAGFLSSFIVGYISIGFLLKYVKTKSLMPFIIYRFLLVGVIILFLVL